jgi:hypothetical protein
MKKRKVRGHRQAKKTQRSDIVVGVCWYTAQDWERVKATATDPELFENSFAEWETMANQSLATLRTTYPGLVKVLVAADEFFAWCLVRGRSNDSSARSEFAAEVVTRRQSSGNSENDTHN